MSKRTTEETKVSSLRRSSRTLRNMSRNCLRDLDSHNALSVESLVLRPKNLDRFVGELLEPPVRPWRSFKASVDFRAEGRMDVFGEMGEEEGCCFADRRKDR